MTPFSSVAMLEKLALLKIAFCRAAVEELYHALLVGGDAGEVGAVENGVLQRAGLEETLSALHFGDAVDGTAAGGNESEHLGRLGHGASLTQAPRHRRWHMASAP